MGGLNGVEHYATVDASYGAYDDRMPHSGCARHIGAGTGAFLSWSMVPYVLSREIVVQLQHL